MGEIVTKPFKSIKCGFYALIFFNQLFFIHLELMTTAERERKNCRLRTVLTSDELPTASPTSFAKNLTLAEQTLTDKAETSA